MRKKKERKDPEAEKDWRQEEEGTTEDEMVRWYHRLSRREFEQTPRVGDGQGSLPCCSPWGHKESDTTEQLNWIESTTKAFQSIILHILQTHPFFFISTVTSLVHTLILTSKIFYLFLLHLFLIPPSEWTFQNTICPCFSLVKIIHWLLITYKIQIT